MTKKNNITKNINKDSHGKYETRDVRRINIVTAIKIRINFETVNILMLNKIEICGRRGIQISLK